MKKKNGVNIMLFVLIIQQFFMFSCTKKSKQSPAGILIKTDQAFSDMSEKAGMHTAFLAFFADSGVILRDNIYPIKGKKALMVLYSKRPDTSFILTWKPVYEKISDSGDLGYTYGFYNSKQKSTGEVSRGSYITIWEKQNDGSWKFVMDTGTDGLPEENK